MGEFEYAYAYAGSGIRPVHPRPPSSYSYSYSHPHLIFPFHSFGDCPRLGRVFCFEGSKVEGIEGEGWIGLEPLANDRDGFTGEGAG